MLPSVANASARIKLIAPVPISVPPTTNKTSLGEGGKTFSTNAKKKELYKSRKVERLQF